MKRLLVTVTSLVISVFAFAQTITARLTEAFQQFEKDAQLKSGLASLYVIDAKSGNVIFAKGETIGLAPASTQKIITSASAYELLGRDFRYKTEFGYAVQNGSTTLYITPGCDPTLGSWRWQATKENAVIQRLIASLKKAGTKEYNSVVVNNKGWESETIPDGWIWQDIGNYYGAGAAALNWRENQFDLLLKSGISIGDRVAISGTVPTLNNYEIVSVATSAAKGSGDNAYIYFPLNGSTGIVRGTIPINENRFVISGTMPSSSDEFLATLFDSLSKSGIKTPKMALPETVVTKSGRGGNDQTTIHTEISPPLDSIIFWFNRRSINLYGEALVKTIAYKTKAVGATDEGVNIVKDYWKSKGIPSTELNIVDGSGLSPLNRVTTHAQVAILHYAKKQPWFAGYFLSLPEFNGMKMKSGTIRGVKGFCGYHTSKSEGDYIFSFLVNNYNGSSSSLVQKMYKVLDILK